MGKADTFLFPEYIWCWSKFKLTCSTFNENMLDCCSWAHISRQQLFVETFALIMAVVIHILLLTCFEAKLLYSSKGALGWSVRHHKEPSLLIRLPAVRLN